MKFNFSLTARRKTFANYDSVQTRIPDIQRELYWAALQLSLADHPYEQDRGSLQRLRELIRENEPLLVTRLAIYLREQLRFRELSYLLTAEWAAQGSNKDLVSRLIGRIVQEPGEVPAWLDAYALATAKKSGKALNKLSRPVRKGLAPVLLQLDEYRFARYDAVLQLRVGRALSRVGPKAKDKDQRILFRKILKDRMPARSTWEAELCALQQQHYDSLALKHTTLRDKWKEGISSFRIGYPALLGRLPDLLAAGVSGKVLKLAGEYLGSGAAIERHNLPLTRFLEVYRELKALDYGGKWLLLNALERAADYNAGHIPGFDEDSKVLVALDLSHSMKRPIREGSLVQRFDIGPLLAMLLQRKCRHVSTGIFGNTWKRIDLPVRDILEGVETFRNREGELGYATNAHLVIQELLKKGEVVDKLMIFTDCRLWGRRLFNQAADANMGSLWSQYRQIAPLAKLYLFDLAGYGHSPLEALRDGVYLVAGWNDRIFDVLEAVEKGFDALEGVR